MNDTAQQEFYRQLGESIRKHRHKRKLSQETLANLIGLKRTSLTNIENGRQHPPLHTFCEIVKHLEAEFSDVLPKTLSTTAAIDLKTIAGSQLHGSNEFAFVQTGIGIKGKESHGNTTEENSGNGRRTSRRERH
jgi:DNA-binding XRE family transcriptional regulator